MTYWIYNPLYWSKNLDPTQNVTDPEHWYKGKNSYKHNQLELFHLWIIWLVSKWVAGEGNRWLNLCSLVPLIEARDRNWNQNRSVKRKLGFRFIFWEPGRFWLFDVKATFFYDRNSRSFLRSDLDIKYLSDTGSLNEMNKYLSGFLIAAVKATVVKFDRMIKKLK